MPPVLYLDVARARAAYAALAEGAAPIRLRYATKANPHPALLAALAADGAHFAVMSLPELQALLALGVPGERIACVTPGPPASLLQRCYAAGVRRFTVDSVWELRKTAALAPGAAVCVALFVGPWGRLTYPWAPLGVQPEALAALLATARDLPIDLCGVAVHVGSQCEQLFPWDLALRDAGAAWEQLRAAGFTPRVLSLGGGLPVPYRSPVPPPTTILQAIQRGLGRYFPAAPGEVWLEPGRYVAAGAGVLAATVLARDEAVKGRKPCLTLDVGRYHGLPEARLGIRYPYHVPGHGAPPVPGTRRARPAGAERCTLLGPPGWPDQLDRAAWLPRLGPGDRLFFLQAGAYTACQAAHPTDETRVRVDVLPPGEALDAILAHGG